MTQLDPRTRAFYVQALRLMEDSGPPFLVGGAYALERHTGIARHTKDFDLFVRPEAVDPTLALFEAEGFRTERTHPHWLAKIYHEDAFVDVIYRSGNGLADVDDSWLERGLPGEVFGRPVRLCPVEEIVWTKAFIMERERFDGGDVAHLLRAQAERLDWARLLSLFGPYWRLLFVHLVLFGFIYPAERDRIPAWVLDDLSRRLADETAAPPPEKRLCQGTLLSRSQYLIDITEWGYEDPRLPPGGRMSPADIAAWTAAIERDGSL